MPSNVFTVLKQKISELSTSDLDAWQRHYDRFSPLATPLLSPAFAQTIAASRSDVRLITVYTGDQLVATLCFHERALGFARPVGAPFDDYSGALICPETGLTIEDLARLAGLNAYRANSHVFQIGELPVSGVPAEQSDGSTYMIELGEHDSKTIIESRRKLYPKRFKNFRRLARKLESECGTVCLRWGHPPEDVLDAVLGWKQKQFQDDGLIDLTEAKNSAATLQALQAIEPEAPDYFGAFMVWLEVDGQVIAGHFGVRLRQAFHPWISSFDDAFADYAPGIQLLCQALDKFQDMGLASYDLASGHAHYKKYFADPVIRTRPVRYYANTPLGLYHRIGYEGWNILGAKRDNGIAARLRRRFDQIAICFDSPIVQVQQVFYAFSKRR